MDAADVRNHSHVCCRRSWHSRIRRIYNRCEFTVFGFGRVVPYYYYQRVGFNAETIIDTEILSYRASMISEARGEGTAFLNTEV